MHSLYNGGVERVLCNLAGELVRSGVRMHLVVNVRGYSPFASQVPASVRLVDLGASRFRQRPIELASYLRREKPHVLLSALHYSNEIAVLSARLAGTGTRVVLTEHTTLSHELATLHRLHPRRLVRQVAWLAYRGADDIVAVSQGVARDLTSLLSLREGRITTVYNPVLTPDIVDRAREPLDHPWFRRGEPPVLLGVGRLEPQKDFHNLLEAFALVRRTHHARLLVLGEGSQRSELERKARTLGSARDVEFHGFVENPFAYLARARAFVLSSAWEGLPTVLVESLAVGTPVIATDCPSGPAEILDGGRYGRLVPARNPAALAAAMSDTLGGKVQSEAPGAWLEQFKVESATRRYLEILKVPGRAPASLAAAS